MRRGDHPGDILGLLGNGRCRYRLRGIGEIIECRAGKAFARSFKTHRFHGACRCLQQFRRKRRFRCNRGYCQDSSQRGKTAQKGETTRLARAAALGKHLLRCETGGLIHPAPIAASDCLIINAKSTVSDRDTLIGGAL